MAYRVCIYSVAMSVKHGLLALLERGPMHGYQLRAAFEESTGGTWPLNIGQVYTTLSRLERDGLAYPCYCTSAELGDLRPKRARISRTDRPRDELAIKLALALCTPGVDVHAVVQTQRSATTEPKCLLRSRTSISGAAISAPPSPSCGYGC